MLRASALPVALFWAAACSFSGATPGLDADGGAALADTGPPPPSSFFRPVVISPPAAGDTTDVPVAIRLTGDDHVAANALADGADIFVLDAQGRQLPLEIEVFNGASGDLVAWVVVPTLAAAGTTLALHYGANEPATGNDANPWENISRLVWHLHAVETNVVADSGPEAVKGTKQPQGTLTAVPGIFGQALDYEDAAIFVDNVDLLDVERQSFAISFWFDQSSAVGQLDTAFFKGGPTVGRPGYQIELGTGNWTVGLRDDDFFPDSASVVFGTEAALGADTGWHQLVAVLDRAGAGSLRAYVDGALVDTSGINNLSSLANRDDAAQVGGVTNPLRGTIDEFRLLSVPVSADWVAIDYANGIDTLAVVGEPVPVLE